jgi:hypothetical protein
MGFLKKVWNKVKNNTSKALGINNSSKTSRPAAGLGPAGDGGSVRRSNRRSKARGARGRDSTIITGGSEVGTRTLLG